MTMVREGMRPGDPLISKSRTDVACYHCGENCRNEIVKSADKDFCCEGCKLVYELLNDKSLCTYYSMNTTPGISPGKMTYSGKYDYLDQEEVINKLAQFKDRHELHIAFYIPSIHCSSCIWLLENLHKLNKGVLKSSVNFLKKEANVILDTRLVKLSEVAALLAHIGYEPLISLDALEVQPESAAGKNRIVKIGLAGFCFGNIMMLSFPEYFSLGNFFDQGGLPHFFAYLNLLLALPVFFYSASGFFTSAWKSIRHGYLNIDAPIALAILVTFLRSVYEILSQTGAGYLDSMSGIVFFMLIGRYFQDRTYERLSFERNYKSYFPVGVSKKTTEGKVVSISATELEEGDLIITRNNEIIPSDSILLSPVAYIDYSFITGESVPVKKHAGELIYAGAKQTAGAIELEVVRPTSQSYLTQLWNNDKSSKQELLEGQGYLDRINKYFSIAVICIASLSSLYWLFADTEKALNALTAVLIVACPCGLLLTSTFANGNIVRILGCNKFYLKNASVIERLSKADTIVFDKTGTISHGSVVDFVGPELEARELQLACALADQSSHPLSRKIYEAFGAGRTWRVDEFEEISGQGIKGIVDGKLIVMGSAKFVNGDVDDETGSTRVYLQIDGNIRGYFSFANAYREGLESILSDLSSRYQLQMLSGDNDAERSHIERIFGKKAGMWFRQKPSDKMEHVKGLQDHGKKVIMLGDGLNDAGALMQSDVGIAVSDDTNNFSPACDAILDGSSFSLLPAFIWLAKTGKKVIIGTFVLSLTYNIIGLSFAIQGLLSPVIAAILMPLSSITIVLLATISTNLAAKFRGL